MNMKLFISGVLAQKEKSTSTTWKSHTLQSWQGCPARRLASWNLYPSQGVVVVVVWWDLQYDMRHASISSTPILISSIVFNYSLVTPCTNSISLFPRNDTSKCQFATLSQSVLMPRQMAHSTRIHRMALQDLPLRRWTRQVQRFLYRWVSVVSKARSLPSIKWVVCNATMHRAVTSGNSWLIHGCGIQWWMIVVYICQYVPISALYWYAIVLTLSQAVASRKERNLASSLSRIA